MLPLDTVSQIEDGMLPFTKEWQAARSAVKSVKVQHYVSPSGHVSKDSCELRVVIRRNFIVYCMKSMVTTILVVIGSLLTACFMHPEENIGDRFAILFIAFLILITNMSMDLGLGVVTALMWVDYFNVIQCVVVLVAVGNSLFVHILFKSQHDRLATTIDHVTRFTIPFVLYPVVTAGAIVWGLEQRMLCPDDELCGVGPTEPAFSTRPSPTIQTIGTLIMALGAALTLLGSAGSIWYFKEARDREQVKSVGALVDLALRSQSLADEKDPPADKSAHIERNKDHAANWNAATARVFRVFDLDSGGSIDYKELRATIHQMYPNADAPLIREAMKETRSHMDAEGELDLSQFQDAIALTMEFFARKAAAGDSTAVPVNCTLKSALDMSTEFLGMNKRRFGSGRLSFRKSSSENSNLNSPRKVSPAAVSVPSFPVAATADVLAQLPTPEPYDPAAPSVVHLKTSGYGILLGHVSATNLPNQLSDLYKYALGAGDDGKQNMLASTVVARLVSRGFNVAAMTNEPAPEGKPAGEVIYLLVRQPSKAAPDAQPSKAAPDPQPSKAAPDPQPSKAAPDPKDASPPMVMEKEQEKEKRSEESSDGRRPGRRKVKKAPPSFDNYMVQSSSMTELPKTNSDIFEEPPPASSEMRAAFGSSVNKSCAAGFL